MANFIQSTTTEGLKATTVNIPTTDVYNFLVTMTLPNLVPTPTAGAGGGAGTGSGGGPEVPSQVVVTVRQNGSTIYTSNPGTLGFQLNTVSCTASDVITFTPSSSLPQDQQPNAVRLTLAASEGPL